MNDTLLSLAIRIQSIAQAGLQYGRDPYDLERYAQLRQIAAEMLSLKTELSTEHSKTAHSAPFASLCAVLHHCVAAWPRRASYFSNSGSVRPLSSAIFSPVIGCTNFKPFASSSCVSAPTLWEYSRDSGVPYWGSPTIGKPRKAQ